MNAQQIFLTIWIYFGEAHIAAARRKLWAMIQHRGTVILPIHPDDAQLAVRYFKKHWRNSPRRWEK